MSGPFLSFYIYFNTAQAQANPGNKAGSSKPPRWTGGQFPAPSSHHPNSSLKRQASGQKINVPVERRIKDWDASDHECCELRSFLLFTF